MFILGKEVNNLEGVLIRNNIKNFIETREIENLFHFTKAENLHSILKYGLLSRQTLSVRGINYLYNDDNRLEGRLDANCVSIEFPNYRMFYKYRQVNPGVEWCVIALDPSILYKKNCLFSKENAASNNEVSLENKCKSGVSGLRRLYENDELRNQLQLCNSFTTNPQAEILVLEDIGVEYIKDIYFRNTPINFKYNLYPDFSFYICQELFDARLDYEYWR